MVNDRNVMWHEIFCFLHQIFDWWFEKSLTAQEKVQKCWKRNQNCAIGVTCVKAKSVSTFVIVGFFARSSFILNVLMEYLRCNCVMCSNGKSVFFSTGQYCWVFLFQWLGFELYVQALYAVRCWTIERFNKQTDPKNPAWNCFYIIQRTGCIFGIT